MPLDLPPDLAEIALRDLGETPEVRDTSLQQLRDKLSQLPAEQTPYRVDDEYLIAFLRGTKVRTQSTRHAGYPWAPSLVHAD
jgi:hypothetical protein